MKKDLMLKILKKLDEESKAPEAKDLGLDKEQYGELLEIMLNGHLIIDATIIRGGIGAKVVSTLVSNAKITAAGMEYLEKNN